MKSKKVKLILQIKGEIESAPGIFEDKLIEKKVTADKETIFQSRRDQARYSGLILEHRFKFRNIKELNIESVKYLGLEYTTFTFDQDNHFTVIEVGEKL